MIALLLCRKVFFGGGGSLLPGYVIALWLLFAGKVLEVTAARVCDCTLVTVS